MGWRPLLPTPAQVMIRWGLQHGMVVIPKSTNQERIQQNAEVFDFELETDELRLLDGLNEHLYTGWSPADVD